MVPLIRYDTSKQQVLAFDKSSNIRLDNLDGLNDAIENAVNLILEFEQESDKKASTGQHEQNTSFKNNGQGNRLENYSQMNQVNYNQMNNNQYGGSFNQPYNQQPYNQPQTNNQVNDQNYYQSNDDKDAFNKNNLYIQIPNSRPLFDTNQYAMNSNYESGKETNYEDNNQKNYNQMDNQVNNQMNNQMNNQVNNQMYYQSNYNQMNNQNNYMNNNDQVHYAYMNNNKNNKNKVLERNQKYVKKLICKSRKHKKRLSSGQYTSGSSSSPNFSNTQFFDNGFSNGYYTQTIEQPPQVIRYPVYVTDYDSELVHRLYKFNNIFI